MKYWVKELLLYESDYQVLNDGSELNDNIIVAGQSLLAKQFPHINGFQDMILINGLKFHPVQKDGVQILHTGKQLGSILGTKVYFMKGHAPCTPPPPPPPQKKRKFKNN